MEDDVRAVSESSASSPHAKKDAQGAEWKARGGGAHTMIMTWPTWFMLVGCEI